MNVGIVTRRYQITIPRDIRKRLGINVGDKVEISCEGGVITVTKIEKSIVGEVSGSYRKYGISSQQLIERFRKEFEVDFSKYVRE